MGVTTIDLGEIGSKVEPLDLMPVGYVYMSFDSTSPAELFGGTWIQLQDVVIRAANNIQTGGADSQSMTLAQMPYHNHGIKYACSDQVPVGYIDGSQGWLWTGAYAMSTQYAGSGTAQNNLPAYQNVFAWRREA